MNNLNTLVGVRLALVTNEMVLLQLRKNTGYNDGLFCLVSGHLESGETPTQAVIREAKEEIGIIISEHDLEQHQPYIRANQSVTKIDFIYSCKKWGGDLINKEPEKCACLGWFNPTELPENVPSDMGNLLQLIDLEANRNR